MQPANIHPITTKEFIAAIPAIHLPFGVDFGKNGMKHVSQVNAEYEGKTLIISKNMSDEGLLLREALPALNKCIEDGIEVRLAPPTIKEVLTRRKSLTKEVCTHSARLALVAYVHTLLSDIIDEFPGGTEILLSKEREMPIVKRPTADSDTIVQSINTLRLKVRWLTCDTNLPDTNKFVTRGSDDTLPDRFMLAVHILIKRLQRLWHDLS